MKISLFDETDPCQPAFLLPRSLTADLLIFLAALPFSERIFSVFSGLFLGTAAMLVNMLLLRHSVARAVEIPSPKAAKRYMFGFYVIRFAIMGAALAAAFKLENFINPFLVFVPLLYPKIFFTASAFGKK